MPGFMLWIKKLFAGKAKQIVVAPDELSSWFQAQMKERLATLDGTTQSFYSEVQRIRQQLREQHNSLIEASIVGEERIEPKVKNIVLGHRANYARELGIFINSIEIPDNSDLQQGTAFYFSLQAKLDEFAQQTQKSFGATRHLFHKEADALASSLKEIDESSRSFHTALSKQGVFVMEEVNKQLMGLKHIREKSQRILDEINLKKARLESAKKQMDSKENEMAALKESADFQDYNLLIEKKQEAVDRLAHAERDIVHVFSDLERPLKKYAYLAIGEEQKTVERYLSDPKKGLAEDRSMKIFQIITSLKDRASSLGLKDDQMQKLMEVLSSLTEERLRTLRSSYIKLHEDYSAMASGIDLHSAISRLKEAEYKRDHFKHQIERFEREITDLEEELGSMDTSALLAHLEQKIRSALGIDVKING